MIELRFNQALERTANHVMRIIFVLCVRRRSVQRWAAMKLGFLGLFLALFLTSCASVSSDPTLSIDWQLRWPAVEDNQMPIRYEFINDNIIVGGTLKRDWIKASETYSTFSWSAAPLSSPHRQLVVRVKNGRMARLFDLQLPKVLSNCSAWSDWVTANYVEDVSDLNQKLLNGLSVPVLQLTEPPTFELKYRVQSVLHPCH